MLRTQSRSLRESLTVADRRDPDPGGVPALVGPGAFAGRGAGSQTVVQRRATPAARSVTDDLDPPNDRTDGPVRVPSSVADWVAGLPAECKDFAHASSLEPAFAGSFHELAAA